ncbi:MAG: tyrosine-type recombinase/integrase, partial [Streptosporangiaceae bacterium]
MTTSFDFRPWKIQTRKGRKAPYRVRWTVAGRQFSNSFVTMALAESFRASLITAARSGEGFHTDSGLPESMERQRRDVSFYEHAAEFTA